MRNRIPVLLPVFALGLITACTNDEEAGDQSGLRARVAIQNLDEVASVELRLTPAVCVPPGVKGKPKPITHVLDITGMLWPDGKPQFETADDYDHEEMLLGESALIAVPGCYTVIAAPLTSKGEPAPSCTAKAADIVIEAGVETTLDMIVECSGELHEPEVANTAPTIVELMARPEISACDATMVCATVSDAEHDRLEFVWDTSSLGDERIAVVRHRINPEDRSVTQCIAVQARESGSYDIGLSVYDLTTDATGGGWARVEDIEGTPSHASSTTTMNATLGCEATGRSAVVMLTLSNEPGLAQEHAFTLVDNIVEWVKPSELTAPPRVLVVLDDAHYGENSRDAEFVHEQMLLGGYTADRIREPVDGLTIDMVESYDIVWFVNPGHPMDDPDTHTTLLRYRAMGGGLVLQGDDMARFFGQPDFMQPLTYLEWQNNGTIACGRTTDNNVGDSYRVAFEPDDGHPILRGLGDLNFAYGNDIDHAMPLGKGEEVLAWARFEAGACMVETPVVIALEPDQLLAW